MTFNSIKEISKISGNIFEKCPLAKEAIAKSFDKPIEQYDKSIVSIDKVKNCPIDGNNGFWEGERGNSKWIPDSDYSPGKANPDKKKWQEFLDKHDIDGIIYKDGEPDFKKISKGDVEIESFTDIRADNFDKADIELAKQKVCSPEEVAKWRKENKYTWHECKDMKTIQKVPSVIHNNVPHRGGISEAKSANSQ